AKLDKANLTGGIKAAGADFQISSLRGADLTGAKLYGADFRSSELQGAILNYAAAQGAKFQRAKLEAVSFQKAQLWGTDFSLADLTAADMRGVRVWRAKPPADDGIRLTDMSGIIVDAPTKYELASVTTSLKGVGNTIIAEQVGEALAPVFAKDPPEDAAADARRWSAMASRILVPRSVIRDGSPTANDTSSLGNDTDAPNPSLSSVPVVYADVLTTHLSRLMCRPLWSDGSVATGVALRALGPMFRGDLREIYQRLKQDDCEASRLLPSNQLKEMSAAADASQ
ncbi:MAG: pentapeptide repeat-containing protein, partial [Pseudomonadota bacterium]